jgi:hypothetical protein
VGGARAVGGRPIDRRELEHDVRGDGAEAAARDLAGDVGAGGPGIDLGGEALGQGDRGVEVCARDRPEGEDQRDEHQGGGGGVLQQLQTDLIGRELLSRDARTDNGGDEHAGAEGLGESARGKRPLGAHVQGRRRRPAGSLPSSARTAPSWVSAWRSRT